MSDLSDRIAALSPQQRAMFELLRKKEQQKKKAAAGPPPGPIPRRGTPGPAPLSFDQERIWFLHQLDPQETAYNLATVTRIRGPVDMPRMTAALNEVVRRHESWRTVFPAVDGRPVQVVLPRLELRVPLIDVQEVPAERRQALALEIARQEALQPFDFDRGPLARAVLIRLVGEEHLCVLVMHHIVTDWVSSQIFWDELAVIYMTFAAGKPSPLPEPPVQYADFAVWQREWMQGEALERYLDFWTEEIAGAPHALELPTDRPRPPFQTTRGALVPLQVPGDRAEALRSLARQERTTTFMALLALYAALLHRLTGEAKVLISAPNANRNRDEIQGLIGFFLTQLVFAVDVSGDPAFRELLSRVRGTALRAFAHQDLPFGKLVEAVRPERDPSRAPLVQVNLLVLDAGPSSSELSGLAFEEVPLEEEVARFDLGLGIFDGAAGLTGFVEYNRDLFDRTTMQRLARAFEIVVEQVGRDPEARVSELRLLEEGALHQVLREWNDTRGEGEGPPLVHRLFEAQAAQAPEAQAAQAPEAPALVTPDGDMTYAELDRRARLLAAWLERLGIGSEAKVGLCVERTADIAVGMLGVWKAGAAWVPLDPAYPEDRLVYILNDAGLAAIVTREGPASRLPETSTPLVSLDVLEREVFPPSPGGMGGGGRGAGGEGLAYVIYTSGTTGKPKGVMVEHGNLAHVLRASHREFGWSAADRIPVLAPFSFDIFLFELWSPLTAGGTAELVPLAPALDLPRLLSGLERATRLHAVPALMRQIVALGRAEGRRWPGVRTIFVGGDAVPPELLAELPEVFPAAEIRVLYGPTEGTIICASLRVPEDREQPIPWWDHGPKTLLGRPLPDAEIRLVDRSGGLAAIGVPGELWIGGPGVTRGYLGRAELTAEKYVEREGRRWYRTGDLARWLPDGLLEFLGRADEQVKVRGFRIEPGEIETALLEHPAVRQAVVVAVAVEGGDKRLVACVVPDAEGGPWEENEGSVRACLARRLPEHMVPSLFVPLADLPLTGHGKVDRRALAKLAVSGAAGAALAPLDATAPRTPAEEALADIWHDLLGVERVGVHDNFFRLGGDSILGIQVVARARQAGLAITPRQIFESQTIAALAAVAQPVAEDAETAEGPVEGEVPLTPVQLRFFEEEPADPDWFNQALLLSVHQPVDPAILARALAGLAERHDALRWALTPKMDRAQIRAVVPSPFLLVDLAGLPEDAFSPAVEVASAQLQTAFDLQNGPVFVAALFSGAVHPSPARGRGAGGEGLRRLLLAAHHLVIDAVSWRILLEDLQTAYGQLAAGASVALPRTTSWKRWAERLTAHARSQAVRKELEHWLALPVPAPLPADLPGTPEMDTAGAASTVSVELPEAATAALLRDANAPYRTRIDDLLLTALAQAFARWTGAPRLMLELEGHGREEIGIGGHRIDLSRTVGWFTTVFPVALDLALNPVEAHGTGEAIKAVKEQLRAVPGKGLSYGLLRYVFAGAGDRRLADRPEPQVGFNYLGQLDAVLPAGSAFAPAPEPAGPAQSPRARRRHRIDVDALVWEGRLQVTWTYASRLFARETMERLAADFSAALEELIAHCLAPEAGGWTPSDLPLARLAPGEVDALFGSDPTVEDVYPLAPLQNGMLFHTLDTPGSEIYFEQLTGTLRGPLDVPAFARAWQAVVDRQPVLRTAFVWEGLKRPLQIVRRGVEVPWTLDDWTSENRQDDATDTDAGARFRAFVAADQGRGFDLARAPLLRLALVRTGPHEHRLLWSFHHLLFDGWCFSILFREVFAFYEAFRRGETLELGPAPAYHAHIAWLERQDPARAEAFWRARLAGVTAPTPVPLDAPEAPAGRAVADFREVEIRLPAPLARNLARAAQEGGLTLNTLVQGAWAVLLERWSGSREVVFGAVAAGRPPDLPDVESMVGLFINTLPVRAAIDPAEPALAWLRRLQEEQVEQRAFEWSPLSSVQRWSELPPGAPLFQSVLVFENYPIDPSLGDRLGDLEIADVRVSERTSYPLTLAAVARDELLLRLGFDARVAPETAERILAQLEIVLAALAEDPGRTLGSLPALPGEDELRARAAAGVRWSAPVLETGPAAPPRDAVEEALCRIWRSVLRLDRIGIHDDFFRLGGDSILSLQIVARAREEGLELTPRQIFEHPTVAGLAAEIRPAAGDEAPAARHQVDPARPPAQLIRLDPAVLDAVVGSDPSVEDLYPLAPLQRGMLLQGLSDTGSELYLEQLSCVLRGALDPDAFRRAWQRVVDRHPALRTSFLWRGIDEPLQVVRRGVELPWEIEDWRGLAEEEKRARWDARIAADRRRVFELDRPPLMRALLARLGEDEHRFLWSFHHLLFDGWCFSLLFREVFQLYEGLRRGEEPHLPPPRPYRDFIAWLQERPAERSESWWRRRLAGFAEPNPLPVDFPSAAEPGERERHLPAAVTADLEAFARRRRLTLNTLFQGAWALLLARSGAGRDVVFGCVVAGRPPELPGIETMIGLFINTLPLRLDVDPDAPAGAWLRGVQEAQLDLRPHEHVPLAEIQGWSELPPGEPLIRSLAVFENYPFDESLGEGARGLEVRDLVVADRASLPLAAVAIPDAAGLVLRLAHDHSTEPATADRLLGHLERLLAGLAEDPDRPLRDIPLLAESERSQLLAWSEVGWRIADPVPEDDLPVHLLFARHAAERPEAPALLDMDGASLSYGELAERAGRLAGVLRGLGVGPETRVGLWLERSPRMIEAVLAILAAGGAYVPIDPETPPERVAFLLEDSQALLLVTQESLAAALPEVAARVMLVEDKDSKDDKDTKDGGTPVSLESFGSFGSSPSLDHLAYVLYTSGSTGRPKGVLVTHRGLAALARAFRGITGVGPADRVLQFASLSFDASVREIFMTLTSGASLVVRSGPAEDAAAFLRRCGRLGCTIVCLPTAYWHLLAAALETGEVEPPAGLRLMTAGGERALQERWAAWGRGSGRRPRLLNCYGPTETTIVATVQEHPGSAVSTGREVPIGRPLPGWRTYVLDGDLQLLPVGAAGELLVGGVGVSRGYLGRPDLTAERFVPDPIGNGRLYRTGDRARWRPDGALEYLGRIDTQVKVRGFRIELGEVEAALAAHPGVRAAAAATRADASGNLRLVAFVVWRAGGEDAAGLLAALARRLPAWMIPSEILPLPALPVTAAGKLDRRALERLAPAAGGAREIRPPSNPVEAGLAEIWSELLGVAPVGLDDDFFALGGHSLLATQLVSRVRQRFGVDLPLHSLFELRTLEEQAREVLARTLGTGQPDEMDRLLAEMDDLSDEEALALLAEEEGEAGGGS